MLIPQFTLRWLLGLMTVGGCVFTVFGFAVRGHPWAIGASMALVSLAIVLLIHALAFALIWGAAQTVTPSPVVRLLPERLPTPPETAPVDTAEHDTPAGDDEEPPEPTAAL